MIYEVLQNTKGNPNDKANLDARILGKLGNTHYVENYEVVADIEADNLEEVFKISNTGDESKITRYAKMHSVSVGDVIRDDKYSYVVKMFGFERLPMSAEYHKARKEVDNGTYITSRKKWN